MNKNLIIGLVLLCVSILCGVLSWVIVRGDYTDSKTQDDCNTWKKDYSKLKDGDSCNIWDSNKCRKGSYHSTSQTCESAGNVWPLVLLIVCGISLIASIVFFVKSTNS
jgi:uncharacterized ion transporter superfamily protein YfcC